MGLKLLSIPIHPFEHFDTSIKSYSQNIQVKGDGYLSLYSLEGEQLFNRLIKREELSTLCGSGELEISKLIGEIKFNKKESKFSLIYSLEEADCPNRLLRNLSQTWVKRENSLTSRIDQNRRHKHWREINQNKFEDNLHTFLCTYTPPKKEKKE